MEYRVVRRLSCLMCVVYLAGFASIHLSLSQTEIVADSQGTQQIRTTDIIRNISHDRVLNESLSRKSQSNVSVSHHKVEHAPLRLATSQNNKKLVLQSLLKKKKLIGPRYINITFVDYVRGTRKICREEDEAEEKRRNNVTVNVGQNVSLSVNNSGHGNFCECFGTNDNFDTRLNIDLNTLLNLTWKDLSYRLRDLNLQEGGAWRPQTCAPRRRIALIIPYRDRESHLKAFLAHTHPILQAQQVDYQIYVIEQNTPFVFNKGSVMNAGFQEVMRLSRDHAPDCVVFHDVDLLVESPNNIFMCRQEVVHFAAFIDKFNYTLPYYKIFGGAVALTPEHFIKVNGYSNKYGGWGGEDDEFFRRVFRKYLTFYRPPKEISRYTMIKHSHDAGNPINKQAFRAYRTRALRSDGLNSVTYSVRSVDYLPTHTRIVINLPDKSNMLKKFDILKSTRCMDGPFREELVSMITCQNMCLHDDRCRGYQYLRGKLGGDRCEMLEFACDRLVADNSTDFYMWKERINLQQALIV